MEDVNKGQVHELLNEAIDLWVEISGVDPEQSSFSMGDFPLKKAHDDLKESTEIDESGFVSCLLTFKRNPPPLGGG